jgi:hypothetical protein
MTRFLLTAEDPGTAARTAKNAPTAPGLPNHSDDRSERNTMVSATRAVLSATARRFANLDTRDQVTYTPEDLNKLISTITAHEVAGRLREHAARHDARADSLSLPDAALRYRVDVIRWHRAEALELRNLADRELAGGVA